MAVTTRARKASAVSSNGKAKDNDMSAPLQVVIPEISVAIAQIRLEGLAPLITDNGDKAIVAIEKQQSGAPKVKHAPREPWKDYRTSCYWTGQTPADLISSESVPMPESGYGMRRLAFKKCIVTAAGRFTEHAKTYMDGVLTIRGDEIVPLIVEGPPIMRCDHVVASMRSDVRYRAQFWPWAVDLRIEYIKQLITVEQIIHLFRLGGRTVGVGNWRPEKHGDFGTFDVGNVKV